jgi:hypothetical protein
MAEIVNIQDINPITFEIQTYSPEDSALINSTTIDSIFNSSTDIIEYFVYDLNSNILFSDVNGYPSYYINNNIITLTPEENLKNAGFTEGNYNTLYNFLTPKLGSNSLNRYFISEISSDRTEIRLDTTAIPNEVVVSSSNDLSNEITNSTGSYYDFYLDFGDNQLIIANNILLDNSNETNPTVLIKLYDALPPQFSIKDELWVVVKVSDSVAYNISIVNTFDIEDEFIYLKGPNTNLNIRDQINNSTNYTNLNNLNNNSKSQGSGSYQYQLNSLLAETGIEINIDYSDYSNFIHFSSAQTRLENFYYKLSLIEQYNYSASLSSGTPTNYYVSSSNIVYQNKINEIITGFDEYEYFLYYESGSTCWPKSNNTPPYVNVLTTSVTGQNWLISQSLVAENYDLENNNALTLAIPSYITDDSSNYQFTLFVEMIGQSFDNTFVYLQDVTNKYNADNRLNYGISKDLVADVLRDMGVKIYQNNFSSDDLYSALIGFTPSGSLYNLPYTTTQYPVPSGSFLEYITTYVTASSTSSLVPTSDINKEQYKRIYHNLPLLLKKKGSTQGLKDLITTFGVPDTILRVNEFGGKDKNPNTWDYGQNEYNYAFSTSGSAFISSSFVLNSSWNSLNNRPQAVEFRFKTDGLPQNTASIASQSLWSTDNGVTLRLRYTGSGYTTASYSGGPVNPYYQYALLEFIPDISSVSTSASIYLPFYDGEWWSVLVNSGSNGFTLYAGNKNNELPNLINFKESSSVTGSNIWNTSLISTFGSSSLKIFTGSFQEIRYYTQPLSSEDFDDYVMNSNSIESSEFLAFRASLGGELYTSSISIHPKITGSWALTSSFASNSIFNISSGGKYVPNTEIHYYDQVPAGIQNAISQKVHQQNIVLPYSSNDNNIPNSKVLSPFISVQQSPSISQSYTRDIDYVEVGFSPQNEINEDINDELGYFNIGEFIGDPRQVSSSAVSYPDLDALRDSYFRKYSKDYQEWDYIRLIQFFDNSLFKTVSDWVPARASLAAGIIIKQHLLERNKYPVPQAEISTSIANVASGSTNLPFYQENILFTGSIPVGTITGSDGGTLPNLNGQTSSVILPGNYNTTVTQVWNGTNIGPLGPVTFTDSYQTEFFDGAFSGSEIVVTTQSLNPGNILLNNQAFYPTIADYQDLNVGVTNNTLINYSSSLFIPTFFPFDSLNRYIDYYNTSSYGYSPKYNTVSNFNIYITGSFYFADPADILYFYITENTNGIYEPLDTLFEVTSSITNVNIKDISLKSGSIYNVFYFFINNTITSSSGSLNSATNWTITTVNPQTIGYPNDPNIYQQSTFPGNLELYPEYNAVFNNVYSNRLSEKYFDVDYSQQGLLPVNQGVIISQSAVYAQIQDSNYTLARSINPRYLGSKNTSAKYNTYTVGDSSYGKAAAIDNYAKYFAYFDWIGGSTYIGGGNIHIINLVDVEGNVITLTPENVNLFNVEQIFKQGDPVYAYQVNNTSVTPDPLPEMTIATGGALYQTILVKSGSGDISNAGLTVNANVINNFPNLFFISGSNILTTASFILNNPISPNPNWLDHIISGSTFNSVTSYTTVGDPDVIQIYNKSANGLRSGTIPVSETLFPLQNGDFIRFGYSNATGAGVTSSLDYSWNNGFLYETITTDTANLVSPFSSSLLVTPSAHSYPQLDSNQAFRIIRRIPNETFVVITKVPTYRGQGLLVPYNFDPRYSPAEIAKRVGLIQ